MLTIPTETNIKKYIKRIVFGNHIFCPRCNSFNVIVNDGRYRCRVCRTKFSLLSHTWLANTKLPLTHIWLLLFCWTQQVPVKQSMKFTELSEKAVRHYFDLFRIHLPKDQAILEHLVQLDEAYFGKFGGYALLMGKQPGTRKLAYDLLFSDAPGRIDAVRFLQQHVKPDARLNTDGSVIYKGIEKHFPVTHTVDIHKKFEFTHTSEIEGMFGVLRTFIRRMYHHTTKEKFPEYMCEFYFRFCRPEMFHSPYEYLKNTLVLGPTG